MSLVLSARFIIDSARSPSGAATATTAPSHKPSRKFETEPLDVGESGPRCHCHDDAPQQTFEGLLRGETPWPSAFGRWPDRRNMTLCQRAR